jgi:hypothetical protein
MAKSSLSQQTVRQYALVGAQARLDALRAEMQSLLGAFPELARKRGPAAAAASTLPSAGSAKGRRRGRRRAMSPEERREVSERMKRYWASRRKEKSK